MKKVNLFLLLLAFLITASGCNTIAGVAKGATEGAAAGLSKDVKITWQTTWQTVNKTDDWLKKHAW